ncbi:hypothetical protein [Streptomyces sp. NPDC000851]
MSYPAQVYWGDSGEISADFRPESTPPDLGERGNGAIHYLATTATTRGEFGLYRVEMKAKAGGPRTHFHQVSQLAHATDEERAKFFDKHDSYFVE